MKKGLMLAVPVVCSVLALTACQQNTNQNASQTANQTGKANQLQTQSAAGTSDHTQGTHLHDAGVIPSANSHKLRTTNELGGTSKGLGSSVYSMIGSSGLHSEGFSSHLESRLSGAGIEGVKVFVFDDTVVLATDHLQKSGAQIDSLQQKVLSPHGGQSGKGQEPGTSVGTLGSNAGSDDNLGQAELRIRDFIGGNVKVIKATGAEAVQTIDRMKANASSSSLSPSELANDLRKLLDMAQK
ncbi:MULTISPECIES: hypothetical protein [Paenibacillus]|uniref:hypothetical protein n=1 Tax=Paenibacillus TaxID=44249 RepID=UPI0022B8A97A|nr:hypothetical protein [Paenibacillus caseinilyticus]MCZ8521634.1 hypothetical protein [Paenibacillus caseinilyticus]